MATSLDRRQFAGAACSLFGFPIPEMIARSFGVLPGEGEVEVARQQTLYADNLKVYYTSARDLRVGKTLVVEAVQPNLPWPGIITSYFLEDQRDASRFFTLENALPAWGLIKRLRAEGGWSGVADRLCQQAALFWLDDFTAEERSELAEQIPTPDRLDALYAIEGAVDHASYGQLAFAVGWVDNTWHMHKLLAIVDRPQPERIALSYLGSKQYERLIG